MSITTTTSRTTERSRAWRAARAARIDVLLALRQQFPNAFARLSDRKRVPLRVGVHHDIQTAVPELGSIEIACALHHYVSGLSYLRACTEGATRVDLTGAPAGVVTAAEAEHAQSKLAKIEAKLARRQAAKAAKPAPTAPEKPRLTFSDLRLAAASRKANGPPQ
jgi:ProP effector